jgi:hypothetical protein
MPTPTVTVTIDLTNILGEPLEGVVVTARMDKNDLYDGIVIAGTAKATTNAGGITTMELFPNALPTDDPPGLGTTGSVYRFMASITGGRKLDVQAVVPNQDVDLHSIVVSDADEQRPAFTAGSIRWDVAQSLSGAQQQQARDNIGLGEVDDTSDEDKPVSTAQAAADATVLATAQAYADGLVVKLWDDRGSYDASGNTFPAAAGSGAAGAIKTGDIWTISVAGVLGGHVVNAGDTVRALADAPGQTDANWAIAENNIGYVPANSADLASSDPGKGATLVGHSGTTVADLLDAITLVDYAALRAYSGAAKNVHLCGYLVTAAPSGIAGDFTRDDSDVTSADNGGTVIVDALNRRWKRQLNGRVVDVRWFGADPTFTDDSTTALQKVLDNNYIGDLGGGKYKITSDLVIDPIRNRGCGFVSDSPASRYPYTQQTGGPAWNGQQEGVIFYDGAVSTSACVIRASAEAVGVEPAATFDNTIYSLILENVTLDANSKAGFGLYAARVQDLQLRHARARGATVAGGSINGTYSGSMESCRFYLNPGRGFELGAADERWGWAAQDKVNAFYIRDLHCDANGSAGTFRQADANLRKEGCGFYFGPHRGVRAEGVVSENNFGANVVYEPSSTSNAIEGLYTELGCKYAPGGAGTDAISLGYATDQLGVIFIGAAAATHNRIEDYACATDKAWLTGTEPTASREEGAFELNNVSLAGGLIADWGNYRLVNCSVELESITGSQPLGAFTVKGGIQFGAGQDILNTYDEGAWTPAFEGITNAGTGWTYSVQVGQYTKIGRHVFFTGRITLTAVSADAAGQIAVTGLPFTVKNTTGAHGSVQLSSAANLATAVVQLDGTLAINTTRFTLQRRTAAATSAGSMALADISATTSITFSGHYAV